MSWIFPLFLFDIFTCEFNLNWNTNTRLLLHLSLYVRFGVVYFDQRLGAQLFSAFFLQKKLKKAKNCSKFLQKTRFSKFAPKRWSKYTTVLSQDNKCLKLNNSFNTIIFWEKHFLINCDYRLIKVPNLTWGWKNFLWTLCTSRGFCRYCENNLRGSSNNFYLGEGSSDQKDWEHST